MERSDFLDQLYIEIVAGLMYMAGCGEEPPIDLFDTTKSDIEKIQAIIEKEFNYAFFIILQDDYDARQFVKNKFKSVPNKMMKIRHVLDDEEIHSLAEDILKYEIFRIDSEYRLWLETDLQEKGEILSDVNAQKFLSLFMMNSTLEIINWFINEGRKFISIEQIARFIHNAEVNNINREAIQKKYNQNAE